MRIEVTFSLERQSICSQVGCAIKNKQLLVFIYYLQKLKGNVDNMFPLVLWVSIRLGEKIGNDLIIVTESSELLLNLISEKGLSDKLAAIGKNFHHFSMGYLIVCYPCELYTYGKVVL